jgi:hypothetical protein
MLLPSGPISYLASDICARLRASWIRGPMMHMESAPGAGRIVVPTETSPLARGGRIPVSHAIPGKHCGTLDMADDKSQIL